jgi:hypothetical protein
MEVVDADHLVTIGQQAVDQVRPEKAGATRDHNTASVALVSFLSQGAVHDTIDDVLHDDTCSLPAPAIHSQRCRTVQSWDSSRWYRIRVIGSGFPGNRRTRRGLDRWPRDSDSERACRANSWRVADGALRSQPWGRSLVFGPRPRECSPLPRPRRAAPRAILGIGSAPARWCSVALGGGACKFGNQP